MTRDDMNDRIAEIDEMLDDADHRIQAIMFEMNALQAEQQDLIDVLQGEDEDVDDGPSDESLRRDERRQMGITDG